MPNLPGGFELIIILVIVMVIFGGAKLPKLARSLREAKDEFEGSSKADPKNADPKKAAPRKELEPTTTKAADDYAAGDDKVTLSRAELDALLTEREQKAKRD